jgi:hypothetical protein
MRKMICVAALLLGAGQANADILVQTYDDSARANTVPTLPDFLGQQFELTTTVHITSYDFYVHTPAAAGSLTAFLGYDSSNSPGSVIAGSTVVGSAQVSGKDIRFILSTPLTLGPGAYWLDLAEPSPSSKAASAVAWDYQLNGIINPVLAGFATQYYWVGTVGIGTPAAFYISGSVPEPSTWAMMLLGFGGLSFAGWRARRKIAAAIA